MGAKVWFKDKSELEGKWVLRHGAVARWSDPLSSVPSEPRQIVSAKGKDEAPRLYYDNGSFVDW